MFTKQWYKTHPHPRGMQGKRLSEVSRKLISQKLTGRIVSETARKHMSEVKMGAKHPKWVGDKITRVALHVWLRRHLPRSAKCQCCGIQPPYDLANIDNVYNRDPKHWEWLCRKCHMTKDGRLEKFKTSYRRNHPL